MGTNRPENEMGNEFINPIIILLKGDTIKIVLDARYLNSVTDLSSYYWPLEPLEMLLTRIKGKWFTTADMAYAYAQTPLTEATQRLCGFVTGGTGWNFRVGFYGVAGLPSFFSRVMTFFFEPMIKTNTAITYIDDVLLQTETKEEMFKAIQQFHQVLHKNNIKADPTKTYFFQRSITFLGHQISGEGISPTLKRVEQLQNLPFPTNKDRLFESRFTTPISHSSSPLKS